MHFGRISIAAIAAITLTCSVAHAAIVSDHFDLSAPGSAFVGSPGAAFAATQTVSFDITFDTSQTYTNATSGITNFTHSFADDSGVGFSYDPINKYLTVGGLSDGVGDVLFGTNDFYLHITNFTTTQDFQQIGFTKANGDYYYTPAASAVTVTIGPVSTVSTVPLPGSLPMFGAALLGVASVGFARRRRKAATSLPAIA